MANLSLLLTAFVPLCSIGTWTNYGSYVSNSTVERLIAIGKISLLCSIATSHFHGLSIRSNEFFFLLQNALARVLQRKQNIGDAARRCNSYYRGKFKYIFTSLVFIMLLNEILLIDGCTVYENNCESLFVLYLNIFSSKCTLIFGRFFIGFWSIEYSQKRSVWCYLILNLHKCKIV